MTDKFVITGMTCAACAAHVERAAASVPGVHSASVNLMLGCSVHLVVGNLEDCLRKIPKNKKMLNLKA